MLFRLRLRLRLWAFYHASGRLRLLIATTLGDSVSDSDSAPLVLTMTFLRTHMCLSKWEEIA